MKLNAICEITKEDIEHYKTLWETEDIEEIVNILETIFYDEIFMKNEFFNFIGFSVKIVDK